MDWFLYDNGFRHERVKNFAKFTEKHLCLSFFYSKIEDLRQHYISLLRFLANVFGDTAVQ